MTEDKDRESLGAGSTTEIIKEKKRQCLADMVNKYPWLVDVLTSLNKNGVLAVIVSGWVIYGKPSYDNVQMIPSVLDKMVKTEIRVDKIESILGERDVAINELTKKKDEHALKITHLEELIGKINFDDRWRKSDMKNWVDGRDKRNRKPPCSECEWPEIR
jgi:hypothetical protein